MATFKFEKFMLFRYGQKPKKEWKAQDAGNFFIKFYLITICVTGLTSVYIFLATTNFAKDEDNLRENLDLCSIRVGMDGLGPSSEDDLASCTTVNDTKITIEASNACGPFVHEQSSVWDMVQSDVTDGGSVTQVVYEIFVNVLVVWFFVLYFYLRLSFTKTSVSVMESSMIERNQTFESMNAANEAKIRKLNKQVQKLEMQVSAM